MVTEVTAADVVEAGRETVERNLVNGRFVPGNRGGPGRPRKGESVLEQTHKVAETKARQIARAHVNRMLREDSVGNRAWADYRDTFYGVPKQTLTIESENGGSLTTFIMAQLGIDIPQLPAPEQ